jgi:predicted RNase H-like HicB family nuclease
MKQKILKYDVIFEEQSANGYTVTAPALPGCISEGDTFEEAKTNIMDAIKLFVEDLAADSEAIPNGDANIFMGQVSINNPLIHYLCQA